MLCNLIKFIYKSYLETLFDKRNFFVVGEMMPKFLHTIITHNLDYTKLEVSCPIGNWDRE